MHRVITSVRCGVMLDVARSLGFVGMLLSIALLRRFTFYGWPPWPGPCRQAPMRFASCSWPSAPSPRALCAIECLPKVCWGVWQQGHGGS